MSDIQLYIGLNIKAIPVSVNGNCNGPANQTKRENSQCPVWFDFETGSCTKKVVRRGSLTGSLASFSWKSSNIFVQIVEPVVSSELVSNELCFEEQLPSCLSALLFLDRSKILFCLWHCCLSVWGRHSSASTVTVTSIPVVSISVGWHPLSGEFSHIHGTECSQLQERFLCKKREFYSLMSGS